MILLPPSARGPLRRAAPYLLLTVVVALPQAMSQSTDPGRSPDGLWQTLPAVEFPERYSPPTAYVALSLDAARLEALLANAPRETFGPIPPQTQLWLPLAAGGFAQVSLAQSQLMEASLASQFPQLKTYVFAGDGIAGHVALGPSGAHLSAQVGTELWRIDPVETAAGRVYVSYLDAHRTDGANLIVHDPHMHENEGEPPLPAAVLRRLRDGQALSPLAAPDFAAALEAGSQLRIYRLAASTTGEFYQAREGGFGLLGVVFSLINDVAGANAVFEPEVSVRLVLAAASLDVIYDDPATDPFDNSSRQCSTSLNACTTDADCDTANGETCDLVKTACALREDNRDNMKAVLDDGDYDLGFLFGARDGGGANGCAWFVVCQTASDTLHKARGAGLMGNNGANSASGLLAHEVGHQLGARHTFTGQAGGCTLNEFLAGDSESGYEPGSGTTRMSYNGNCDSDNVDVDTSTGALPAGSYFHSRSFDEIVDNVFNGDGASCGTLVNTGNSPPDVIAGPDYTIPRQTPFTLVGTGMDDQPLTFNWEQFDRALTQRPINTDPGDGPIIRSIPPSADPSRTVPQLQDLLNGITRAGEILPQVDRTLNFRLIARDNLMGGGGVAYDSMQIAVQGDPFFITSPNSGAFEAACEVPLTWQVGGGSVAAQVQALFSGDGGQNFAIPLTGAIANDGAGSFAMPCTLGTQGRIKLQSVDNIFFDVNDNNLTVFNNPPQVATSTAGGAVDDMCEFTVQFSATAIDSCGLDDADVSVELIKGANNFTLGTPTINLQQVSPNQVNVSGSVVVSDLLDSPAQLTVQVTAADACGAEGSDSAQALVIDDTPPQIDVALAPDTLWPPNHMLVPIHASVIASDNCPGVSYTLASVVSDEPDNGIGDGDTVNDIQGALPGTPDLDFLLRSERMGGGDGRVYTATYTAKDGSDNVVNDAATVTVPKSKSK